MIDVQLVDGTSVDSHSEVWREECEAREVLRIPTKFARQEYLDRVGRRRGANARASLEVAVLAVWNSGK